MARAGRGDPVRLTARDWNLMQDTARRWQMRQNSGLPLEPQSPARKIMVRSGYSGTLDQGAVVSIGANFYISRTVDPNNFFTRPVFSCGIISNQYNLVGVLAQPLTLGRVGQIIIGGIAACQVTLNTAGDEYCLPAVGTTAFTSNARYGYRILRLEGSTGGNTYWGWVYLNPPAVSPTVYRGKLNGVLKGSTTSISVDTLTPINALDPAGTTSLTAHNVYALVGPDNSDCRVEWNLTDAQWEITQVEFTSRYKGQMQGALATSDTSKTVDNLQALDGPGGVSSVTAYNVHSWEADDNAVTKIEWNAEAAQWEIYQVTCPA